MQRLVAALLLLAACGDEGDPVRPSDPQPAPDVSYVEAVQPIFNAWCVGCHGAAGNGGLDLRGPQSHANLVGVEATGYDAIRVVPSDPGASVLYDKVSGGGRYGDRMPLGGPYLSAEQLGTVRDWIAQGAPPE